MKRLLSLLSLTALLASCAPAMTGLHAAELDQARTQIEAYAQTQGARQNVTLVTGLAKLNVVAASLRGNPDGVRTAYTHQLDYLMQCDPLPVRSGPEAERIWAEALAEQLRVAAHLQQLANGTPALAQAQAQAEAWLSSGQGEASINSLTDEPECSHLERVIRDMARTW